MSKGLRFGMLAVLSLCLFTTATLAGGARDGDVNVILGQKKISDDNLEDLDVDGQSQFGVAVSLDFEWPVQLAIDLLSSSDDNSDSFVYDYGSYTYTYTLRADVETMELQVGVRKFWGDKRRPYVGGGIGWATLDGSLSARGVFDPGGTVAFDLIDDDDSDIGFWINGGIMWRIRERFNVGIDVRFSDASAELTPVPLGPGMPLPDIDVDSGGTHVGVLLGYHW